MDQGIELGFNRKRMNTQTLCSTGYKAEKSVLKNQDHKRAHSTTPLMTYKTKLHPQGKGMREKKGRGKRSEGEELGGGT